MADLRGRYAGESDNFPAFLGAPPDRLRGDMESLPPLAEDGLVAAGKDISQGGVIGTALMLAECSDVGMTIDPHAVPRPEGAELGRWARAPERRAPDEGASSGMRRFDA